MRSEYGIVAPGVLLLALILVLAFVPGVAAVGAAPFAVALPLVVLGLALVLGLVFTQSRVSHCAAVVAVITLQGGLWFFQPEAWADALSLEGLAAVLLPLFAAIQFRLDERGVLTAHGGSRAAGLAVVLVVLTLLPMTPLLHVVAGPAGFRIFRPMSAALALPVAALPALLIALFFLLLPREHESPSLGPLLAIAVLYALCGLNYDSVLWAPDRSRAAFVLFMSGSGLTLGWAVLESGWRHATIDELTQLPARRALKHHFRCLGDEYAIAVVDVDHFKKFNDTYGHDVGDQVLRFLAAQLQRNGVGKAYRLGGEEFVIVCEGAPFEATVEALDHLRQSISQREFQLRGEDRPLRKPKKPSLERKARDRGLRITVSMGVGRPRRHAGTPQAVLEAADRALYEAKENGRNRVCASE
jgi:diguanylate cyclase (GGDEF)-like protein